MLATRHPELGEERAAKLMLRGALANSRHTHGAAERAAHRRIRSGRY